MRVFQNAQQIQSSLETRKNVFLFHFESSFCSRDNQILTASYHATYAFYVLEWIYTVQVPECRELLARKRRDILSLSDCNRIRTLNHLIRKWTLNHLAKLAMVECSFTSGCGFKSRCSHLSQILTYIRSNIQMSWFHQMPKHTKYILLNNMVSKHSLVMNFGQFI